MWHLGIGKRIEMIEMEIKKKKNEKNTMELKETQRKGKRK